MPITTSTKANGYLTKAGEPDKRLAVNDTAWTASFLMELRQHGVIGKACVVAKVSRNRVRDLLHLDPSFREAFEDAKADAMDRLWERAVSRAIGGSDKLMIFLLQMGHPGLYMGEARGDTSVEEKTNVVNNLILTHPQLAAQLHRLLGSAGSNSGRPSDVVEPGEMVPSISPPPPLTGTGGSGLGD